MAGHLQKGRKKVDIEARLDYTDQRIKDHEDLTKFFTTIVALTLVGTLVGLGGLYINAFNDSNQYKINNQKVRDLEIEIVQERLKSNTQSELLEKINKKYPWIFD